MDQRAVLDKLIAIHREVETDCGEDPDCVTDDILPLDDLGGFDSLTIPTVVRRVAKALDIPIPKGQRLPNPYVSEDGKQKLKLRDVAERFRKLYCKEAKP